MDETTNLSQMFSSSRRDQKQMGIVREIKKESPEAVHVDLLSDATTNTSDDSCPESRPQSLSIWRNPQPKAVAPYLPSSSAADRNLRRIMHHYTNTIVASSLCAGPKRDFFPAAVQDETLFHATIFATAMHDSWLRGVPMPLEVYQHRGRAIRLLNEKLSGDISESGAFDSIINTIFFMLITETFDGLAENVRVHRDGLIQLVKIAGGLNCLGLSGITRRSALWADLIAAVVLREEPKLQSLNPDYELVDYFGPANTETRCLATAFGTRLHTLTGCQELSKQAALVFWGLRGLTALSDIRRLEEFVDTAGPDDIQYSDRAEALERIMVPLWLKRSTNCKFGHIFSMLAWGSLIYVYADLRDAPIGMSLYAGLADRIRVDMEERQQLDTIFETFPDLMLWILFLGGRVSPVQRKSYFARQAAKILAIQGIEMEVNIKLAARAFLWPSE